MARPMGRTAAGDLALTPSEGSEPLTVAARPERHPIGRSTPPPATTSDARFAARGVHLISAGKAPMMIRYAATPWDMSSPDWPATG